MLSPQAIPNKGWVFATRDARSQSVFEHFARPHAPTPPALPELSPSHSMIEGETCPLVDLRTKLFDRRRHREDPIALLILGDRIPQTKPPRSASRDLL